jgi:uroporphyrinogen decarboxylase
MDAMFVGLMTQPDDVRALLDFCVDVVHEFGKAFADVGAGVAVFDSLASPDLLSPAHYREFVAPATSALIERLHTLGLEYVPVIIGGDTSAIAGDIVASGANNVLCDFSAEWEAWLETAESAGVAVRRNIEPSLLSEGTAEAVFERMTALRQEGASYPGFIGGTAVVPYGAPLENLLAARDACRASGSGGGVAEPA